MNGYLAKGLRLRGLVRDLARNMAMVAVLTVAATATAAAQGYSQEQERLCTPDAMRLCSHEIPNIERITTCMVMKKRELSPGCRSVFTAGQQAKARPAARPRVAAVGPDGNPVPRRVARPARAKPTTASTGSKAAAAPKTVRPAAKKPAAKPEAGKS